MSGTYSKVRYEMGERSRRNIVAVVGGGGGGSEVIVFCFFVSCFMHQAMQSSLNLASYTSTLGIWQLPLHPSEEITK